MLVIRNRHRNRNRDRHRDSGLEARSQPTDIGYRISDIGNRISEIGTRNTWLFLNPQLFIEPANSEQVNLRTNDRDYDLDCSVTPDFLPIFAGLFFLSPILIRRHRDPQAGSPACEPRSRISGKTFQLQRQ